MGQSQCFDLRLLGVEYERVVDSAVLTQRSIGGKGKKKKKEGNEKLNGGVKKEGGALQRDGVKKEGDAEEMEVANRWKPRIIRIGLKALCDAFLGIEIQESTHDALEDAFAAREVVLWCLEHPREMRTRVKRLIYQGRAKNSRKGAKQDEQKKNRKGKGKATGAVNVPLGASGAGRQGSVYEEGKSDIEEDDDYDERFEFPFDRREDIVGAYGETYARWFKENEAPLGYDSDGYYY